ncbi:MAG TPA: chromate efflux transporter [Gemmatimonadaceae bacterium]|nr:chromate efflux transporter [Gemmatimonadaceae bacterium]
MAFRPASRESNTESEQTSLAELARLFMKLGTIAFGGPAAHIAMMEDEVVVRRRWLTREAFTDYLGATNLIPGPNSTELAIHIGHARAGWPGLVVAGVSFILPAACIVTAIAWAYVRFGALPAAIGILYGVKPVVIAVVVQALWRLGRSALKSTWLAVIAGAAMIAVAMGVNELLVLAAGGVLATTSRWRLTPDARAPLLLFIRSSLTRTNAAAIGTVGAISAAGSATSVALWPLFGVFCKIGAVLFGSGYVLLAFMRADLVERLHWLTERQLLDAVAVGQITPGPVFTTATFVGYILAGGSGAAVATIGMFLPAFIFVAISGPLVPKLRRSPIAALVLDGVNVVSLALMTVVTFQLAQTALVDWLSVVLAVASGLALFRFRPNSVWLVLAAAAVGLFATIAC